MATDKNTVIAAMNAYVGKHGNTYSRWRVGIASDPEQRLFGDHAVKRDGDAWIYHPCGTSDTARAVEKHFLALGMDGGSGGGDNSSTYVYAYKIQPHTVEKN